MRKIPECEDVFVTEYSQNMWPVLGWLMDSRLAMSDDCAPASRSAFLGSGPGWSRHSTNALRQGHSAVTAGLAWRSPVTAVCKYTKLSSGRKP